MHRLVNDVVLYRFLLRRAASRINVKLFNGNPQRPTRETLASRNILRGVGVSRQVSEGQYIGGQASVRIYESSESIRRRMTETAVRKSLIDRPDPLELS